MDDDYPPLDPFRPAMTFAAIAERLGISKRSVQDDHDRALRKLRATFRVLAGGGCPERWAFDED